MRRSDPSAGPAPHILSVEGLTKTHMTDGGQVPAVRSVDLQIARGEFVAVTGTSGAGKSTLLHLLGGLIRPDSGRIHLDGRRVDGFSEARWAVLRRRRIGIVFQFFNLVSTLTVADNIELPALLAGRTPRQARAAREELLSLLGLNGKEDSLPSDLAGGEQQRVALARALVNRPDILLADEPTGSLDSRGTREVIRLLSHFHQQGQTIVLVTHDAKVASTADRVISFFDGRITDDTTFDGPAVPPVAAADVVELTG
ncbi:ABC transporter ATP-binding protein [Streptomyces sp. H10-C2]|uniref:ABC transporter ATP-binding protein n=1 Tax=unclassified Streptomyces TaxID=2593676 RepID=UPI0024B87B17|nr:MULTISPECIES: ABC transporter ATP-binding protein [unclassified Streptomyces]MDJ0340973.1 ABC transporter ATP-binding protein [Streptomyces sp. PH10-H1]MDJ0369795.1 ABC transporter ATP-binding protein [Streptomyces sp. H10-C2]